MKTLRQRLLTTLLVWLALVLAVFGVVVFLLVRQSLQGDVDQFVRDKAFLLGAQVNPFYPAGLAVDEKPWRSDRYNGRGQVFDTNWNVTYKSARLDEPIVPTEELKRLASHPIGVVHHDTVGPDGARYRMATVRIEREGKLVCYSQIGVLFRDRDKPLRQFIFWLAGCGAVALLLAGLGLDYMIRQWGAPLAALSETARKVNLGSLGHQRLFAPPEAPELTQLTAAFNELLDRLEAAHASQHRFVADASHELRTPLAALRAEIEVALRRERAPVDYQRTLDSNRHELERLSSLVENLLALAALDASKPQNAKSPVDLALVCRDVAEQLSPLAAAQNVRLQLELSENVIVPGDVFALERAVRNLIENAVRHTPAGEQIVVRAALESGEARVQVIDAGIGIAPEHLPRLFERFYRVDTARNRAHGGAGLGLSIVKAIVEAHGGSVSVESKLGAGSTFTLRLPG
ncbi:MAG TPA: ATP-binding protein [Candidatus Acidoferrum sp.]|nr:ATP-binding protein [Candidatus Acidoferrum sp.]